MVQFTQKFLARIGLRKCAKCGTRMISVMSYLAKVKKLEIDASRKTRRKITIEELQDFRKAVEYRYAKIRVLCESSTNKSAMVCPECLHQEQFQWGKWITFEDTNISTIRHLVYVRKLIPKLTGKQALFMSQHV